MRQGNVNLPANPYAPKRFDKALDSTTGNPMGIGVEQLQGGVAQPPKVNWLPGGGSFHTTNIAGNRMSPILRRMLQQRARPATARDLMQY